MKQFCPNCLAEREFDHIVKPETLVVRGEPIQVQSKIAVCVECGQEIFSMAAEEENLKAAYDRYRQRHGLLTPDDIRLVREKYGLSQRALSRILGWGIVTIQRYERGALQDQIHDTVLKKVRDDPSLLREFLQKNRAALSDKEYARTDRLLLEMLAERLGTGATRVYGSVMELVCPSDETLRGLQSFNRTRLQQVMGRIVSSSPKPFKTKVARLLWLCDFSAFVALGRSITGLAYCRMPYGPAPHGYQLMLGELDCEGAIYLNPCRFESGGGDLIELRENTGTDHLTDDELAVIDRVISKYGQLSSRELSRESHKESIWSSRSDGDHLPYCEATSVSMVRALQ